MKRLIVAAAALVWAGAAFAGDYHQADSLRCSECHTMHASRAHGLASPNANDDVGWNGGPAFPNDHLLIQAGVNVTCLACHDNTAAPDVFATNEQGPAQNKRSAGALNGTVAGHDGSGYQDWMGHTMGSALNPPGFVGSWDPASEGFHCGNCHAIHGSDRFRNLGAGAAVLPGVYKKVGTASQKTAGAFNDIGPVYNAFNPVAGSRSIATPDDPSYDVFVNVATRTYQTDAVEFRIGAGGMNVYCAVCHGQFHNAGADTTNTVGATGAFVRHPTTGAAVGSGQNTTAIVDATANARLLARPAYLNNTKTAGASAEAACLSCHKGHGNQYGFGLVAPAQTVADANLEQGDAALVEGKYPIRNLCVTCHVAY